jgi:P27 family predicted phage terminase small subunit
MRKKTKQEKIISGTFRADRDDGKEKLKAKQVNELPAAPTWLSKSGREYYDRLTEILLYAGILSSSDLDMLAILAAELSRYRESYLAIQKEGAVIKLANGYYKANQYNQICEKAFRNASELAQGWGFTFQSRDKMGIHIQPKFHYSLLNSLGHDGEDILQDWFGHLSVRDLEALIKDLGKYTADRKSGKITSEADDIQ